MELEGAVTKLVSARPDWRSAGPELEGGLAECRPRRRVLRGCVGGVRAWQSADGWWRWGSWVVQARSYNRR
jgi:hypothetical protein